jgi:O-antigen/teichoic acid export membrane protein
MRGVGAARPVVVISGDLDGPAGHGLYGDPVRVDDRTGVEPAARHRHRRTSGRKLLSAGLELNAIALMATSGLTALFGLVFWGVAARYPASEVGRSSALISTAMMMSTVAGLAVGLVFVRFLGSAGPRARSMVLAGYGITAGVAAVLGTAFVLFFTSDALFASWTERAAFPVLVVVLALFALQDWVLIGMRESRWVPFEQLLFSGIKLGLVALFAVFALHNGIVFAWVAPAALAVLVISPLLLVRVLPRRAAKDGAAQLPGRRDLAVLFVGEYATGATSVIVPLFMPLIVVARLGTQANAYYALPWLVSEAITVLLWNVSSSYITEASNDVRNGPALMRRAWRLSWLIGLLGTPFLVFGAPILLSLVGGAYAAEGTTLLRLMALALPLTVVFSTYIAIARVQQQMGRVVILQSLSAAVVVTLALVLVHPLGISGIGVAYLVAEAIGAAVVAIPLIRFFRSSREPSEPLTERIEIVPATEHMATVRVEGERP